METTDSKEEEIEYTVKIGLRVYRGVVEHAFANEFKVLELRFKNNKVALITIKGSPILFDENMKKSQDLKKAKKKAKDGQSR